MAYIEEFDIIKYLSKYIPISKDLEKIILRYSTIKNIKKGTVVLKECDISNECFFILKGCMKKYYLIDGEEKITGFFTEGQVVIPASYTNRLPSKYYVSTLENTITFFGSPDSEKEIHKKHPELEPVTRMLAEKVMVDLGDEFDNWVSRNPEERYLQLLNDRPDLIQRIPQYQIANYLGIKPESLSRIRKRITK